MQLCCASVLGVLEDDLQIRARQLALTALRPFDQQNRAFITKIAQADKHQFFRIS